MLWNFVLLGNGRFDFAGYSQFRTGGSGAYEGNLLISDAAIERNLSEYIPAEEVFKLRDRLEQELFLNKTQRMCTLLVVWHASCIVIP